MRLVQAVASTVMVSVLCAAGLDLVGTVRAQSPNRPFQGAALYQPHESSPCLVTTTVSAEPSILLLGEQMTTSLYTRATCPSKVFALHVVLVLDATNRLAAGEHREMKDAAVGIAEEVLEHGDEYARVGVVEYHTRARTLTHMTHEETRVLSGIRRLQRSDGDRLDLGLVEGLRVFTRARSAYGVSASDTHEVMVVFSNGPAEGECQDVLRKARQVKGQGILLITVCVGQECDAQCLRQAASSPRYFYQLQNAATLRETFRWLHPEPAQIMLKKLTLTATLASDMRLLHSERPPGTISFDHDRGVVGWSTTYVPRDGVTVSLLVEPLAPGFVPVVDSAVGVFRDTWNRDGAFAADTAHALVLQPLPVPLPD